MELQLPAFHYSLFGLVIRSDLHLPELPLLFHPDPKPDITIERGAVPETLAGPGLVTIRDGEVLSIEGVARFRIFGGSRIVIDHDPEVPEANIRLYLLGSAMGAILHQRALLPLHANSVQIGELTAAFMGESGAGKSTLAVWFLDQGHSVIGDDVCLIDFDEEGRPSVLPGLRRLRLWKDALGQTGRDFTKYERSYAGDDVWEKFDVPLPPGDPVQGPKALSAIYYLKEGSAFGLERLRGAAAVEAISENTYRREYLAVTGTVKAHMSSCIRLAQQVPVFQLSRPKDLKTGFKIVPYLVDHVRSL